MKTQKTSRTVKVFKSIFKFREWVDFDRIQLVARFIWERIQAFFIPETALKDDFSTQKKFSDLMTSLNLTEADLTAKKTNFLLLSLLMFVCFLGIAAYMIYLIRYGALMAGLVCVVLSVVALALSFRYHYWYYQIKSRQLGCKISEWFFKGLLGRRL